MNTYYTRVIKYDTNPNFVHFEGAKIFEKLPATCASSLIPPRFGPRKMTPEYTPGLPVTALVDGPSKIHQAVSGAMQRLLVAGEKAERSCFHRLWAGLLEKFNKKCSLEGHPTASHFFGEVGFCTDLTTIWTKHTGIIRHPRRNKDFLNGGGSTTSRVNTSLAE